MERDVKRYDCNVTMRGRDRNSREKVERKEGGRGTVHSIQFIQLNARRCVHTRNTAATAVAVSILKCCCYSNERVHRVYFGTQCLCARVCAVFFPCDSQSVVLGSDCRCFVYSLSLSLSLHSLLLPVLHGHTMHCTTSCKSGIRLGFGFGTVFR